MSSAANKKMVLVVDDDPQIRVLVRAILVRHGFEVVEAEDGQAAYELLQQIGGDLQLIVTDIQMPRMDGFTLAGKVGIEFPNIRILYISGFASALAEGVPSRPLVRKPVAPATLIEQVRKLLTA